MNETNLSSIIDCFKMFPNLKEVSLYKYYGLSSNEIASLAQYLISQHSNNLKSLIIHLLNYDYATFKDFCKVFEQGA
jgi:hypothetical protein